jgi:hypothetical protein
MVPGGELGHNPTVLGVYWNLTRYAIREDSLAILNDSGGCFVTTRLNRENQHVKTCFLK